MRNNTDQPITLCLRDRAITVEPGEELVDYTDLGWFMVDNTIGYIPKIMCAKCGKEATVVRVASRDGRWLDAHCHGEIVRTEFVSEPNQTVTLWSPAVISSSQKISSAGSSERSPTPDTPT
jgi:hypothetical protein